VHVVNHVHDQHHVEGPGAEAARSALGRVANVVRLWSPLNSRPGVGARSIPVYSIAGIRCTRAVAIDPSPQPISAIRLACGASYRITPRRTRFRRR
jgi:hypothetical protein